MICRPAVYRGHQIILGIKFSTGIIDELVKSHKLVTPAKAGVHNILEYLDSRFRGNDKNGAKRTFYERIIIASFAILAYVLKPDFRIPFLATTFISNRRDFTELQ